MIALAVFLALCGCKNVSDDKSMQIEITEEITIKPTQEITAEVKNTLIIYTPTPTIEITPSPTTEPIETKNLEEFTASLKHTLRGVIYENFELGFSLTFPEYWESSFLIYGNEIFKITFMGESKTSMKVVDNENLGLSLFMIVPENKIKNIISDDLILIGTANNVKYYYATYTDCEICALKDEIYDYEEGSSIYQDDEEEIELVRKDLEQFTKMKSDIMGVLASFKSIN